ncbi:efflux RND transporter periplasmic adaptor subunit [Polycladidibacter stylochi]|uniref:efflux RND transporter periplasmic adaptor subunit n=1 Tax=Polycladidibacter stylochi TaxID=1807766 RepID=UPI00082B1D2F|nr:efflux RND transporter periplasmic adaptor subunit [Pseudovibrio stylochi]
MGIRFSHLLAIGIAGSIGLWMASGTIVRSGEGDNENSTPPPAQRLEKASTKLFTVRVKEVSAQLRHPTLEIRGRTEADAKVEVKAETNGRVVKRIVQEGSKVKTGDLLCVLDRGAREARVLQANARLAQAEINYKATTQLQGKGFIADNKIAEMKATLDGAKASLREAEVELSRTEIRSPIDGVIEAPITEVGSMLAMGGTCAKVVNPNPMLMIGAVSENNVQKIHVGQVAKVKLIGGKVVTGAVRYIAQSSDMNTRTFRVEIEIPNSDHSLRDGLTATAFLALDTQNVHFISPGVLTLSDEGSIGVRAVDENDTVVFYPVEIVGGDTDGVWLDGLPAKFRLITVGQDFVKAGEVVEPVLERVEAN